MLAQKDTSSRQGFTRLELVVILATLTLLAAVAIPTLAASRPHSSRVQCENNLRLIGQGLQVWANDNGDQFPWRVSRSCCPTAVDYFLAVSNEFGSPRLLTCPADSARSATLNWSSFYYGNLSYFVGIHADLTKSRCWLSGDRTISGAEGESCNYGSSGCTGIRSSATVSWNTGTTGNILFSDGSTAETSNRQLPAYIQSSVLLETNREMHILKPQ
jgi:hypothetical protein